MNLYRNQAYTAWKRTKQGSTILTHCSQIWKENDIQIIKQKIMTTMSTSDHKYNLSIAHRHIHVLTDRKTNQVLLEKYVSQTKS